MNYEQKEKLYDAAIWGAGGLASAAILMDLFRSHKRRRDAAEGKDENTMTLYMPSRGQSKAASVGEDENLKEAAGITNLLIASILAGGTFYGANSLYRKWREGELKKEMEEAAGQYVEGVQDSVAPPQQKMANGLWDAGVDMSKAITLLSFIAGGAGTYGILENTFPDTSEKPKPGAPKKIVVKNFGTVFSDSKNQGRLAGDDKKRQAEVSKEEEERNREKEEEVLQDAPAKKRDYTFGFGSKDQQKAAAYTALICASRETENSPLADLMGRILMDKSAAGLVKELHNTDFLGAISASKGGNIIYKAASDGAKVAAAMSLFGSRELRPSAALLLIGEMHDFNPEAALVSKIAAADYSTAVVATKLASTLLQQGNVPPDPTAVDDADPWLSDYYDDDKGGLEEGDAEGNEKAEGDEAPDPVEDAIEEFTPFQGAL